MIDRSRPSSRQLRGARRLCVAVALAASSTAGERLAHAADPPLRMAFGAGAAGRSVEGQWQPALPIELTLLPHPVLMASLGGVFSDGTVAHGYLELGVYFGVSLGAGAGVGSYTTPDGRVSSDTTFHIFTGLPIPVYPPDFLRDPLGALDERWWGYALPYYRPSWGPWSGTAHEVGVMLKASYRVSGTYGKLIGG
ncbi:hypothetical protein [Sorangium sp. So ce1335]|uniref:hypothetical protein n=1 Tax=Sorangium sp. So ce1335 TaxID=3133335 RepID=UPI003F5DF632